MKQRVDDFQKRNKHLSKMNDQDLKAYFYKLIDEMIDPMLELSHQYTTPAIERSVLMRMGFSSVEAKAITDLMFRTRFAFPWCWTCCF
jgi:D-ornithine 4,5-aminomutase subunit alpha